MFFIVFYFILFRPRKPYLGFSTHRILLSVNKWLVGLHSRGKTCSTSHIFQCLVLEVTQFCQSISKYSKKHLYFFMLYHASFIALSQLFSFKIYISFYKLKIVCVFMCVHIYTHMCIYIYLYRYTHIYKTNHS